MCQSHERLRTLFLKLGGWGRKGLKTPFVYQCFCAPSSKTKHAPRDGAWSVRSAGLTLQRLQSAPRSPNIFPKLTPLHMIGISISSQKEKSTHLMTTHTVHTCHTHTSCNVGSILDTFDFCSLFSREEQIWYTGPFITPTHTQVSERTPPLYSLFLPSFIEVELASKHCKCLQYRV